MENILGSIGTILLSLIVTFLFNYFVTLPKKIKSSKDKEEEEKKELNKRIKALEEAVSKYPKYREQSLNIQETLQETDKSILDLCNAIKEDVVANREMLDTRLINLERREKNALRAKILEEYRNYTDSRKNSMLAWSEMEHHSFFELVKDYEELGGNDYVHNVIIPEVNRLDVIPMSNLKRLKEMYDGRSAK